MIFRRKHMEKEETHFTRRERERKEAKAFRGALPVDNGLIYEGVLYELAEPFSGKYCSFEDCRKCGFGLLLIENEYKCDLCSLFKRIFKKSDKDAPKGVRYGIIKDRRLYVANDCGSSYTYCGKCAIEGFCTTDVCFRLDCSWFNEVERGNDLKPYRL